jgi:hypothetical protein
MKGGNETTYLSRSSDRSRERMAQHGDLNHDLTTESFGGRLRRSPSTYDHN